jgi:TetR/AcrR family transcriptional regulator of autoinduction and epiphytic fitness
MGRRGAEAVDGRADRVMRSRLAICNACLDLVQEGVLQPSADLIADRAGLSRRSIFYHFKDLAELYDAVVEAGMRRCEPLLVTIPPELSASRRIGRLVEIRSKFFEATAPFARALTAQALVGAAREQAWRVSKDALNAQRADVERLFAAELESLTASERQETLEALAAAVSQPTWEYLRRSRGLSSPRARAIVARSLAAILGDAD